MSHLTDTPSLRLPRWIPLLLFSAFLIYFLPAPWQEIRIHDTFDGNFSTREVLIRSGHLFDLNPTTTVPGIMNGLPRGVFPRNTEITSVLMWCFGSLGGYALTFLIVRILAAIGLYRLGKDHLKIPDEHNGLLLMVSVLFACLPFFIIHGLTVAGLPLVFWAFLNVYKGWRIKFSFLIFTLFVLWSNFILVGVHLLLVLGIWFLYLAVRDRRVHWVLLLACVYIAVLYVASDYMLFYTHYFNKNYESSRHAMEKTLGLNLNGVLGSTLKTFFTGDYSTAAYFGFIFLPLMGMIVYHRIIRRISDYWLKTALLGMLVCLVFAFCINLLDWKAMAAFYEKIPIAKVFNMKRFTSLLPSVFFITVLVTVAYTVKTFGNRVQALTMFTLLLLFVFIWRGNISHARSGFTTTGLAICNDQQITYSQFYDQILYKRITSHLENYRGNIIHFGLSPSPSKHFGLNVLDDYQGDYPKTYKADFRKIIEGELEKSPALNDYFDKWGSRCYLESAKSFENTLEVKNGWLSELELRINTLQLKRMNCHYILSSIRIGNARQLGLQLEKVVIGQQAAKTVLIYKIKT